MSEQGSVEQAPVPAGSSEVTPEAAPEVTPESPAAVAERMAPQVRLIRVGVVSALLAVVCAVIALVGFPADAGRDLGFAIGALVAAVVLSGCCLAQLLIWRRAFGAWRADRVFGADAAVRASWLVHVVSYPVLLAALYLFIEASLLGGMVDAPGYALGVGILLLLIAQTTAAVQYLRVDGGPGTIPNHLRALAAHIRAQR